MRNWWGTISAAIYRRGSEGRTQSTGSNMTISDMHSWISRTTTWVGVVVSDKYVWVQNCSANYVWVGSLYSARLLNLSRLWLVLRQTVVVQTTTAHPLLRKILWKNSEGKIGRISKSLIRYDTRLNSSATIAIWVESDDCNLSREKYADSGITSRSYRYWGY